MFIKILFLLIASCFSLSAFSAELSSANPPVWSSIKHIVVILFENTSAAEALKQPYLKQLTAKGALLSQYSAITHPSQPNYLALIGGSTFGVTNDNNVNLSGQHLGNTLNAIHLSWRSYAEGYPGNCYLGANKGTYYRKHVPFLSFTKVSKDATQCAKVQPGIEFFNHLNANTLPNFSFYTPDINNDGHNTSVTYASQYLSNTFGHVLNDPTVLKDTLFIITFDEDDNSENNRVYTVFIGAGVKPGVTSSVKYNHYSLLKTIESIYGLASLGRSDKTANVISDIWQS